MPTFQHISNELTLLADKSKAKFLHSYFKTEKGEYGEGDVFIGVTVPKQRKVAQKHHKADFSHVLKLLNSKIHEHRFTALEILVIKFEKAKTQKEKQQIVDFYLKNRKNINNWDLVDTSAPYILGEYLTKESRESLYKLADSKNIWDRRISIVATYALIKKGEFSDTFKLVKKLISDKHHLIHKAAGWMLREIGKKDMEALINFLDAYHTDMPRVMVRYAIEQFPQHLRIIYLSKKESL